ncbi:dihydropteroate synthase [Lichenibacterium dinghuense]|uniref:dihydropteroate synthase n=1 Tax=Lichenibacterium dinghuense TaxID=2895977 RepID=UPI001F026596|nr:dihydropteroate synthase [Lichenibacterium sp. 6Y81]
MRPDIAARLDALFRDADADWPVMGILNVTPDSFSDGGRHDAAPVARGEALASEGAAVLDIGGESTRPGFTPVPAEEEWRRIAPAVEALAASLPVPVSVDTTKAAVARRALAAGAAVVNDVWGFLGDPAMAETVAEAGAGAVLMHNRDGIDPALDIVGDMLGFFERALRHAESAGVARARIALDPGIGFGKTQAQQVEAIRGVGRLRAAFGLPVLVGLSKKRFLGHITGAPVERRGVETVAANLAAAAAGASIFRVHDVAEHVAALKVFRAVHRAGGPA